MLVILCYKIILMVLILTMKIVLLCQKEQEYNGLLILLRKFVTNYQLISIF